MKKKGSLEKEKKTLQFVLLFASLYILLSINTRAQFNKVIFRKSVNIAYEAPNVYKLGDINNDGFIEEGDDISWRQPYGYFTQIYYPI